MLTSESLGSFPFRKSFDLLISAVVCFHTIIYHHGIDLRKVFFFVQSPWDHVAGTGKGCDLQSH